jgi:hypothetical protein
MDKRFLECVFAMLNRMLISMFGSLFAIIQAI